MKEILYNYDNLLKEDITETIIRVKILLINKKNEIMLGYCDNIYQFPGGHLEEGESFLSCIKREVLEETGIELDVELLKIKPFFKISYFNRDYPSKGINRSSEVYYYYLKTDKQPDLNKVNYTKNEKKGKFEVKKISIDTIEKILIENIPSNSKNKIIVPEMIEVIKEFLKINSNN